MAAPPAPARKGERWQQWAAMAVLFSFGYLALTAAGGVGGVSHPPPPPAADFDTGFMVLAENDRAPLGIAWGNSTDETVASTPITVQELTFFSGRFDSV